MPEYVEDWDKAEYRCPECNETDCFFEIVTLDGWRSVSIKHLESEGMPVVSALDNLGYGDRDVDWTTASRTGYIGCGNCTWEGGDDLLELHVPYKLGWDGKPLDKPLPGQLDLLP